MTNEERLLRRNFELVMDLSRAAAALTASAIVLAEQQNLIQAMNGTIECLRLDLAEARAGRSVRQ